MSSTTVDIFQLPTEDPKTTYFGVPGTAIIQQSLSLPKLNGKQLQQAVMLQLAQYTQDEINNYHIITKQIEHKTITLRCPHHLMTTLNQQNTNATQQILLPDYYYLPYQADQFSIAFIDGHVLLRVDEYTGFSLPLTQFSSLFENIAHELALPNKVDLYCQAQHVATAQTILQSYVISHCHQDIHSLTDITNSASAPHGLNLWSGVYRRKQQHQRQYKLGQVASVVLICAFVFHLASYAWLTHMAHKQINKNQQQITKLYYQAFPKATAIIAPRVRLTRLLNSATKYQANQQFLAMLNQLGASMTPGITLQSIRYADQHMSLHIHANNITRYNHYLQQLRQVAMGTLSIKSVHEQQGKISALLDLTVKDAHE